MVPLRPVVDAHLSNNDRLREPVSPTLASTTKLPGTLANSANSSRDGPCERLAGTARISFGLGLGLDDVGNEGYVWRRAVGEEKNSRCLESAQHGP